MAKSRSFGLVSTVLVAVVASGVTIGASHFLKLGQLGSGGGDDEQIKQVVATYIQDNPQAIVDSLQNWQLKAEARRAEEQSNAVEKYADVFSKNEKGLFPEAGNPDADVVVVEFYDYNCPACKTLFESLDTLLQQDKNVRVLFGEFPIFGPMSDLNAKIALAVHKLGGSDAYFKFHTAMMRHKGKADSTFALNTAKGIGLNPDEVKEEANKPEYTDHLNEVRKIAQDLSVRGTPAIIIGNRMFNGVIDLKAIKQQIMWARDEKERAIDKKDEE